MLNNPKANHKQTRGCKGPGMEGFIARWYAGNAQQDMKRYKNDARTIAENVAKDAKILEIAPGPGYVSIELAKLENYQITGLDLSHTFVEIARNNAAAANVSVDFRQGNVAEMPFGDEAYDFIFCSSAFKNFAEPQEALNEMHRVLKADGRALIVDMRRDASLAAVQDYVRTLDVNWINSLVMLWTFKFSLIPRAYTKKGFEELIGRTQFSRYEIEESPIGFEIWLNVDSRKTGESVERIL